MQEPRYDNESEMEIMADLLSDAIANDPYAYVLHAYPWGVPGTPLEDHAGPRRWQRRVLKKLRNHIRANLKAGREAMVGLEKVVYKTFRKAVASGRGIGKSALVAWLSGWMMSTRIGASVIISANSEKQLQSITWAELLKWFYMSVNAHWWEYSATRIVPAAWIAKIVQRDMQKGTRYWACEGRLWTEENPDSYAGVHNHDGVMLIFDEASGIPPSIWSVAEGFFTENTPNRFWFAFSNPRRNSGSFYECFHVDRDRWDPENIDARDIEGNDPASYAGIINRFGADSNQAKVEVYGQFPEQDDDQFIAPWLVDQAMARDRYHDPLAPIVVGVDPARGGSDSTVIVVRQGRDVIGIKRFKNDDTMVTAGHVIDVIDEFEPDMVVVDIGGVGAGVFDRLREQKYKVKGVNFSNSPKNGRMYGNKRAEMWGDMRDWLGTASLMLMAKDPNMKADLTGPNVKYDSAGVIFLEKKEDMKKRGKASPDAADALAVTFAYPVGQRRRVDRRKGHNYPTNIPSTSWMGS